MLLAAFDDVEKAADSVGEIIAEGIIPAGLEMMDALAIQAAEDFVHAGYPRDAKAILLCEVDGTNEEVSEHSKRVYDVLTAYGASEVRTARDEAERLRFLAGPKIRVPCRRPLITRLLLYGRYSSQKTTGYCTDPYQPVIRALSTAGG